MRVERPGHGFDPGGGHPRRHSPRQTARPGIIDETGYRRFWHRFTLLATTIETTGLALPGEDRRMDIHEVVSMVIDLYRPFVAIDGTDFETWARRRSWGKTPELDPDRELPDDIETVPNGAVSESDGKPLHTKDPDAREGHRSGKNGSPGNIYTGSETHLATQIPAVGEDADVVPHIVLGMHLVPASSHRGTAAVKPVDSVVARGREIREIAADRGYTPCKPESFVWPLWQRDLDAIGDLHPTQRGTTPGPRNPARSGSTTAPTPKPSLPDSATSPASNASKTPRQIRQTCPTSLRRTAPATRTATSGSKAPPSQAKSAARTFHGPCDCHTPDRPPHAHRANPAA